MALSAVGATNIGSIELFIEPELRTNKPKKLFPTESPEERVYDPEGHGLMIKKGKEVGVFNMGSTVVLVFQAPTAKSPDGSKSSLDYQFCVIKKGDRVQVGQALGRWKDYIMLCTNNIQPEPARSIGHLGKGLGSKTISIFVLRYRAQILSI